MAETEDVTANFGLLSNHERSHIFGFVIDTENYLNLILVCQQWQDVIREHSLLEQTALRKIKAINFRRTRLAAKDKFILRSVFYSLKNPKSIFYKPKAGEGCPEDEQQESRKRAWPRVTTTIFTMICSYVQGLASARPCPHHPYSHTVNYIIYDVIKTFLESLATEVVEKMQKIVDTDQTSVNPSPVHVLKQELWYEWQRWYGIAVKNVLRMSHSLHSNFLNPRRFPGGYKSFENLIESIMAKAMAETMALTGGRKRDIYGNPVVDAIGLLKALVVQEGRTIGAAASAPNNNSDRVTRLRMRRRAKLSMEMHSSKPKSSMEMLCYILGQAQRLQRRPASTAA